MGTCECQPSAIDQLADAKPDVALVDVAPPEYLTTVRQLRQACPHVGLVALAVDEQEPSVLKLAEAHVRGWVTCRQSMDELLETIKRVAQGESVYPPSLVSALLGDLAARGARAPLFQVEPLTAREQQILDLVARHLSNKEIAHLLNISEATVKSHVHHLLEKLKVTKRSQVAARLPAIQHKGA